MNGLREKLGLTDKRMSDIARYGQIWVNFGQNGSFLNLSRKSETFICFQLQILGLKQKIANSKELIARKMRKTFWVKMANIGHSLANMGKTGFFSKSVWNIFSVRTSPN